MYIFIFHLSYIYILPFTNLNICCSLLGEEQFIEGRVDDINYYCFPIKDTISYHYYLENYIHNLIKRVKPDVVHLFGSEFPNIFAMVKVCEKLGMLDRVVINIQGMVSIIPKHYNLGLSQKIINEKIKGKSIADDRENIVKRSKFEIESLKKVKNVIGRTDWDKACTKQINPNINYYFCNENLKIAFMKKIGYRCL